MGQRPTRKAGILKARNLEPSLQRTLDSIIERLEVIDGLRGDELDKAVTFRDLAGSNFELSIGTGAGGTSQITPPPSGGGGGAPVPEVGPTTPVTNLGVNETFLALQISWDMPPSNVQHVEVWRNTVGSLTGAVMIGITTSSLFMDYVGAESGELFYWARAVATDGTKAAYTGPVSGGTGVDPGTILLDPNKFQLQDIGAGIIAPFLVGTIDGEDAVGLSGQFIVDGSIRASSIIADSIGAREIFVESLQAITATMGTLRSGRITTGLDGTEAQDWEDQTSFRVELEGIVGTAYPLWYGSGAKSAGTGLFYVDQNGNVVVKGLLQAGMIRQSFFTPAAAGFNDSFRIACEYYSDPSSYSGGAYSGTSAHILPMISANSTTQSQMAQNGGNSSQITNGYPNYTLNYLSDPVFWVDTRVISDVVTFSGPFRNTSTVYGRLGTYGEMMWVQCSASFEVDVPANVPDNVSASSVEVNVEYRYDGGSWQRLTVFPITMRFSAGSVAFSQVFRTKSTAWTTVEFRLVSGITTLGAATSGAEGFPDLLTLYHLNSSLTVFCPNFGVSDASGVLLAS